MKAEITTTVDLLRHGEPEGGVRYRGARDDPLSPRGWEQMRLAVDGQAPWDVIVSSPLRRCAEFAEELSRRCQLPMEIEHGLREISFGAWEGLTPAEVAVTAPEAQDRFWRDPETYPPPGAEPLTEFAARVGRAWQDLLERHGERHVLVVSHGGVIRMVLCQLLEMPLQRLWRLEVPYAVFSRVRVYGRGVLSQPTLVFHGKGLA